MTKLQELEAIVTYELLYSYKVKCDDCGLEEVYCNGTFVHCRKEEKTND